MKKWITTFLAFVVLNSGNVVQCQEWLYVHIVSKKVYPETPLLMVMTNRGGIKGHVLYNEIKDLDLITYDFSGVPDRTRFNFLKECFGIDTITPAELGALFGIGAAITYAYVESTGPVLHTFDDLNKAFVEGRLRQNSVTITIH